MGGAQQAGRSTGNNVQRYTGQMLSHLPFLLQTPHKRTGLQEFNHVGDEAPRQIQSAISTVGEYKVAADRPQQGTKCVGCYKNRVGNAAYCQYF